jgi:UDP-N-acetylmuramoyl-L-alanyl-D-glutamate--2,6-diaminopimelate ligase
VSQRFDSPHDLAVWLRERVSGVLHSDSRKVGAHDAFVAWPGGVHDARQFVDAALGDGAAAVVVEDQGLAAWGPWDGRVASLPQLKRRAGELASGFYGHPTQAMDVVAVTGTNGKTSTAWWLAQLLGALKRPCAVVGTLGLGTPQHTSGHWDWTPTGLTTPDPVLLHSQCAQWLRSGIKTCVMEASSIGLVEGRLNAAHIRVAVFTNFTQDHLDFHGDMAAYWAAKSSLFAWPSLSGAVINVDDPKGLELVAAWPHGADSLWSVGTHDQPGKAPRLQALAIEHDGNGQRFTLIERDAEGQTVGQWSVQCPLVGRYNVSNLLCVWGAARALGVTMEEAMAATAGLTPVPGRLQPVSSGAPAEPLVLVDYAHTPDAVALVLQTARELAQQRGGTLWTLLGCGGDRDRGKRPLMAAAAERFTDRLVLTSDNPRSESPTAIVQDMIAGLRKPASVLVEMDRAQAIALAVRLAADRDVLVLAGKGHETHQEIAGVRHPFSDAHEALLALQRRVSNQGAAA